MADFGMLNFSVAFNPTSAFPLDARSYFETLADAQAAAASAAEVGSTNTVYHYGQKLLVKEGDTYKWYEIGADKTLKETGVYMRSSGGYVQFSTNKEDWVNVIAVSELKGDKGDKGDTGAKGETGDTGAAGPAGADGAAGADGKDGADGLSPTVTVEVIDGGHRVTITDANGSQSFDVLDGADGVAGSGGSGECNLPAIAERTETELFPEGDYPFALDESSGFYMFSYSPSPVTLVNGCDYKVLWDGNEYYCTAVSLEVDGGDGIALGNLSMFDSANEDTKEPFIVMCTTDGSAIAAYTTDKDDTNKIGFYKINDSADEGKFLQVVNGKWAAVTIELAEDGGF